MEPTTREIAGWLRRASAISLGRGQLIYELNQCESEYSELSTEEANLFLSRAAQVEAMGERRCLAINDDELAALIELLCHSQFDVKFEQRITRMRGEVLSMWKKRDSQCGSGRKMEG